MSEENKLQKVESTQVLSLKEQISIAEQFAEIVAASPLYSKNFEILVEDEKNPGTMIKTIRKEDIISCILLGRELGLPDMVSITFGKTLDKLAYFKVMKGKTLGYDPITSLQRIYAYEKDGNILTGLDGHAINSVIINGGITYTFLVDFKPRKYYRDSKTKAFLGYELDEKYVIVNKGIKPADLQAALNSSKVPVLEDTTYYSEVLFKRKGWDDHKEEYSLLDATEAGLYKGLDMNGNEVKGKPSWNQHPKTILNGRIISIGGRKIGGDILNGLYSADELKDIDENIKIPKSKDIEDAQVLS